MSILATVDPAVQVTEGIRQRWTIETAFGEEQLFLKQEIRNLPDSANLERPNAVKCLLSLCFLTLCAMVSLNATAMSWVAMED